MGVNRHLPILAGGVLPGGAKETRTPDPLLAKEVAAIGGPAAAQVKSTAGCPVSARESPRATLLTGTWRARLGSRYCKALTI
jgi:hypothetical protein